MSTPRRNSLALRNPPKELAGFPRWALTTERVLYRAHRAGQSPWWFASEDDGRFNLPKPDGTCYLASDAPVALRERFGQNLHALGWVTEAMAAETEVSALHVPSRRQLANPGSSRAVDFKVTREINTTSRYSLTRKWAVALFAAGLAGLRYEPRFSTNQRSLSVALFGAAGLADWDRDPDPMPGVQAVQEAGIEVASVPALSALTFAPAPRRPRSSRAR